MGAYCQAQPEDVWARGEFACVIAEIAGD